MHDATPSSLRRASPVPWHGRAVLGTGWVAFEGSAGDNRLHAHHALQLALGLDEPIRAQVGQASIEATGLLIAADIAHALHPGSARIRLLYVERESVLGRRLAATCPHGFRTLDPAQCEALHRVWPAAVASDSVSGPHELMDLLAGTASVSNAIDRGTPARVRAVIATLPDRVADDLAMAGLATEAALSPSRFAHCFRAETGLAVRPYLRWLRLARALDLAARGASLTAAAHAAGFADTAHLSRTMQRHFGVAPSDVLGSLRGR